MLTLATKSSPEAAPPVAPPALPPVPPRSASRRRMFRCRRCSRPRGPTSRSQRPRGPPARSACRQRPSRRRCFLPPRSCRRRPQGALPTPVGAPTRLPPPPPVAIPLPPGAAAPEAPPPAGESTLLGKARPDREQRQCRKLEHRFGHDVLQSMSGARFHDTFPAQGTQPSRRPLVRCMSVPSGFCGSPWRLDAAFKGATIRTGILSPHPDPRPRCRFAGRGQTGAVVLRVRPGRSLRRPSRRRVLRGSRSVFRAGRSSPGCSRTSARGRAGAGTGPSRMPPRRAAGPLVIMRDAVGQEQRLVDVVRDHQRGLAVRRPGSTSTSCSSKRVSESSMPNGSSSSSTFGRSANARARPTRWRMPATARPASCASRRRGRPARGSASTIAAPLGARRLRLRPGRRRACTLSNAVIHGSRHGDWNTTPRSGPGPGISRSSTSDAALASAAAARPRSTAPSTCRSPNGRSGRRTRPCSMREVEVARRSTASPPSGVGYAFVRCEISRYLASLCSCRHHVVDAAAGDAVARATRAAVSAAPPRRAPPGPAGTRSPDCAPP